MLNKRPGRLLALIRLLLVGPAFASVTIADIPHGFALGAWVTAIALACSAVLFGASAFIPLSPVARNRLRVLALAADGAVAIGFAYAFAYESGEPLRTLYLVPPIESGLRFGVLGGTVGALLVMPAVVGLELVHSHYLGMAANWEGVGVRCGIALFSGIVVGQLRSELQRQRAEAEARATEAETLRDQLGHRLDVLEAANRCARALESSLVLEEAFSAFIGAVGRVVPFDRTAVMLADGGEVEVLAAAGLGAETTLAARTRYPLAGSVAEPVLRGEVVYRSNISKPMYADESELLELGLRSRLTVPLFVGGRSIGYMSFTRRAADAFGVEEIELITLLGRLAGTAVQNIRAFEAERRTADELRRLSALRADFVSLVSHELRSPMAAVIGAARTLQARWRELKAEQRESFLALIGDETNRLALLIADVLDTSRIEAGTFSYSFDDVNVGQVVEDVAAAAGLAQDEVAVVAKVSAPLPTIRGDHDRLRQVVSDLIDNAVKYSDAGGEVEVRAYPSDGVVRVAVHDRGPGIAYDQQRLIFEKFGRARNPTGTPGSGLGLFIARSIAEAHGGTLGVHSAPGEGATFTLELPVERR